MLHTALRIVGGLLAVLTSLIAAAIAAALAAVLVVDGDAARPYLADLASDATGREVEIGALEVRRSWQPAVTVRDVVIGNPGWAATDDMLRLEHGRVVFRLKPLLLSLRLEIAELTLQRPVLNLERQQDRANWQLGPPGAAAPKDRGAFPVIEHLVIEGGRLTYRGPNRDSPVEARIRRLEGRSKGLQKPVTLTAAGRYLEKPFDVDLRLGPFAALRNEDKPYPVNAQIHVGSTDASYDGTITAPLQLTGLDGRISLEGRNLEELGAVLGLPVPSSRPYNLAGLISKQQQTWRLGDIDGRLGNTDAHGRLRVELGPSPPLFFARLTSNRLDMADLKGFVGLDPGDKAPTADGGGGGAGGGSEPGATDASDQQTRYLIPNKTFSLERLRSMNLDVTFDGKSVISGGQTLNDFAIDLRLQDGRLSLEPIEFGVFQGSIAGDFILDASQSKPTAEGTIKARRLHLSSILQANDITDLSKGLLRGHARLSSSGNSLHELAARADGEGAMVMQGGRMSSLVIEALALDLQEALAAYFDDGNTPVEIGCLVAPFRVKQGRIKANPWLFNTSDTLFTITGGIDLGTETVQMRILPQPKDFSFFNAETAITITGDLARREAEVNELAVAAKLGLKTLLAPLMPLISPELEQQAKRKGSCPRLLSRLTADRRGSGG